MDTSAVIKYFSYAFSMQAIFFIDSVINDKSIISFITEIELQAWNPTEKDDLVIYNSLLPDHPSLEFPKALLKKQLT